MSSLVLDIDDWPVAPGAPATINRLATYFLLMTGSDVDVTLYYKGSRIGSGKGLQGGDGIGPLSVPYDKIVLESATSQVCKVAVTSDPVTITRLSGVVSISGTVATKKDYQASIDNQGFFASTIAPAVASEYSFVNLFNPVGSGKNIVVFDLSCTLSADSQIVVWGVSDDGGGSFQRNSDSQYLGGASGVGEIYRGSRAGSSRASTDPTVVATLYAEYVSASEGWKKKPELQLIVPPGYGVEFECKSVDIALTGSIGFLEVNE